MAGAAAQRVWNTAPGRLQTDLTRPNCATSLSRTQALRIGPGNSVAGVTTEFTRDRQAIRIRPSSLSFYGAEESEQQGPNFPRLLATRLLDRSGFRCYGFRHPLLRGN